jgi:hypothetical protein
VRSTHARQRDRWFGDLCRAVISGKKHWRQIHRLPRLEQPQEL